MTHKPARRPDESIPFWERKTLGQMTEAEWESLCDGCGLCCLNKIEDTETGRYYYTNLACKLLDLETCRCSNYIERKAYVPDCIKLTARSIKRLRHMPKSCAYRRLAEGRGLADWHPLISGDPMSVHRAGISARGRAIHERPDRALEDYIVRWVRC